MEPQVYWDEWEKGGMEAMLADFACESSVLDGATVLAASYSLDNYEGDAYVLFERDGALFCVNGGHCSCNGLEGQWEPEEVTKADVDFRYSGLHSAFHERVRAILLERFPEASSP